MIAAYPQYIALSSKDEVKFLGNTIKRITHSKAAAFSHLVRCGLELVGADTSADDERRAVHSRFASRASLPQLIKTNLCETGHPLTRCHLFRLRSTAFIN